MNRERWFQLTFAQQMGNIGSELTRARLWEEKREETQWIKALERGLVLIDCTLEDPRWRNRLRELTRLREVVCDWYAGQKTYPVPVKFLEDYCTQFSFVY